MKETLKQLGFVKRYDKEFREVEESKLNATNQVVMEAGKAISKQVRPPKCVRDGKVNVNNNATPYVYAPMLSEFMTQNILHWCGLTDTFFKGDYGQRNAEIIGSEHNYKNFITQEITEEILDPFEAVIYRDGSWNIVDSSLNFILSQLNFHHYKTIEQAINDGVLFLFKNEEL